MTRGQDESLAEQLREAIRDSGLSAYALAARSDVSEEVIRRFVIGLRDLRLETAGRLTDALGIELTAGRRRSGGKRK